MIDFKAAFRCAGISAGRFLGTRKSYLILFVMALFSAYIDIPVVRLLIIYEAKIPPVLFVYYSSFFKMLVLQGGMVVFMFSDLMQLDQYTYWNMIRCGKRNYLLGQFIYVFLISLLYTGVLFVISLILVLPAVKSPVTWGSFIRQMCRKLLLLGSEVGITGFTLEMKESLINAVSPVGALAASLLLCVLVTTFLGMLIISLTVLVSRKAGLAFAGILAALPCFARFLGSISLGIWLNYVSPVSWYDINFLDWEGLGGYPSFSYAVAFLLAGILLMGTITSLVYRKKDVESNR